MRFEPMSFAEFESAATRLAELGTPSGSVSVFRYLPADMLTPVSAFLRMRENSRFSFLLESVEGGEQLARYSFIGVHPNRIVKSFGPHTFVESCDGQLRPAVAEDGDVFAVLEEQLSDAHLIHDPSLPPFTSGAVGFMGYDVVRLFEDLPNAPADDLELPDAAWGIFDSVIAFDHARQMIVLMTRAKTAVGDDLDKRRAAYDDAMSVLDSIAAKLNMAHVELPAAVEIAHHETTRSVDRASYVAAVDRARKHIVDGDIFQVVLSQRVDLPFSGDAFNLYRSLRQTNPSPYLFYLDVDGLGIIGSSPESLVRVHDGVISTVPIAGTRPRGASPEQDAFLAEELIRDPKELAEHVMLVDLGRNDIGRVSLPGTVAVTDFQEVVKYSHVMHLVSIVTGQLDPKFTAIDALRACFPAGTVSGAPKVRAMEIIDTLEPKKRGPYAGAVGYIDFAGNLDVCITIRTIIASMGVLHMQAGAGIVADSNAEREWEETENKLRALLAATAVAAGGFTGR